MLDAGGGEAENASMGTPWRAPTERHKGGSDSVGGGIPAWSKWPFVLRAQVISLIAGVVIPLVSLCIGVAASSGPDFEGPGMILALPGAFLMLPGLGLCSILNLQDNLAFPVNAVLYLAAGTFFGVLESDKRKRYAKRSGAGPPKDTPPPVADRGTNQ